MPGKIVVIDDDPDARLYYRVILDELGYEIFEAKDGVEGMICCRRGKPDLIILDLMMPRKGGLKVYNELKEDPNLMSVPVIIVSGAGKETGLDMKNYVHQRPSKKRVLGRPVKADPSDYLEKPVEPERLLNLAKKLLDID